jgi:Raf kinase inhibitor-like YbhB/YbcL family protein
MNNPSRGLLNQGRKRGLSREVILWVIGILCFSNSPTEGAKSAREKEKGEVVMSFELRSVAFEEGGNIPKEYTCDGANISPPLGWGDPPEQTKSFALLVEDPDAPGKTWVHWIIFNLPPEVRQLSDNIPKQKTLAGNQRQGTNDFGKIGYGGPCPPKGAPHRYFFRLYALDKMLDLKPGATKSELLKAMEGHILAKAELMGRYQR